MATMLKKIVVNGIKTGLALTVTTTAAIMLAGEAENGAPWSALNAVAHIVDGDEVTQPNAFSPRESYLGLVVNALAMTAWGVVYEGGLVVTRGRSNLWNAGAGTTLAYLIDYKIVPKRYTPGIEKKLSQNAVLAAYGVLGATLALSPLWNKD